MPIAAAEIEALIRQGLPDARVTLVALRDDDDHYSAVVVSAAFAGQSRVQRHRMVHDALQGKMGGELHALSLRTLTPEEQAAED